MRLCEFLDPNPITESSVLSQPKPYEWVTRDDTNWEATFRFGDHGYWFHAYRTKGKIPPTHQLETLWVVNFGIAKEDSVTLAGHKHASMNMTGLRKPFGIMATIRAIFEDFITQKRPEVIWFSDLHGSSGRKKLYDMATNLLVAKYGYEKDEAVMNYFAREENITGIWMLRAPDPSKLTEGSSFPVDAYHGTGADILAFRPKNQGRGSHFLDIGIHVTEDPVLASQYANYADADMGGTYRYRRGMSADMQTGAPAVYPLKVDPGRVLDLTGRSVPDDVKAAYAQAFAEIASPVTVRRWTQALDYDPVRALTHYQGKAGRRALSRLIRGLGYDSIRYDFGLSGPATNYVIFDPKRIRSRFAAFDPAKHDSANLLDSVGLNDRGATVLESKSEPTIRVVPDDSTEIPAGNAAIFRTKTGEILVRKKWSTNRFIMAHEIGHAKLDGVQPPQWIAAFEDHPDAWDEFLQTSTARSYQQREGMSADEPSMAYDWIEAGADLYMEMVAGRLNDKPNLLQVLHDMMALAS